MATRSRTSFQKRQKEIARMEKQRDKAAKRAQRKLNPAESEESEYLLGEDGLPVLGDDGQPIQIGTRPGGKDGAKSLTNGRRKIGPRQILRKANPFWGKWASLPPGKGPSRS